MKIKTLQTLWNQYNITYFNGSLREIPIRLTKSRHCYGYFHYTTGSENVSIRISSPLNQDIETLRDTLLHEMCHQKLYEENGNADPDHTERFLEEVKRVQLQWPLPTCSVPSQAD